MIFWFGIRFQTSFFLVLSFISKEKSGLKLSIFRDSGKSSDGVRCNVISSFQLSFHDGFGIIDWIFTFGNDAKTCHENTNSSSEVSPFGL
jgi:hypothetical protein